MKKWKSEKYWSYIYTAPNIKKEEEEKEEDEENKRILIGK